MKEQEFRKLLDKYPDGSLSPEEEELLDKFKEDLKLTNESHFQSVDKKRNIEKSLWTGINAQTGISFKNRKSVNRKIAASAAIFIGLIATGYFFLQNLGFNTPDTIPENVITLQLEDGSIKIIEENQTAQGHR